ncbi:MAG: hypothetical protein IV093_03915 [Rubrivivax sp.]|nr:hypothetical protein [Rubrivivax sp.]
MSSLVILPGRLCVLFLVHGATLGAGFAVRPANFLPGLRAACDALGFGELCREEAPPEELLPWAGNV